MAQKLTGKQFEEIKAFYVKIDKNGDGVISETELVDAALATVENCTEDDIKMIKGICDLDGSGTISFTEFLDMMAQFQYNKRRSACGMKCLFKAFDTDKDGVLSRDELKRAWMMFMNKNEETAEESIKGLMEKFDKDGDGKINYDEFLRGIFAIKKGKRRGRWVRRGTGEKGENGEEGEKKKKKRLRKRMLKNAKKDEPSNDDEKESGEADKKADEEPNAKAEECNSTIPEENPAKEE